MKKHDKIFGRLLFWMSLLVMVLVTVVAGSVYTYSSGKLKSSIADMSIKQLNQIETFTDAYVFKNAEVFAAQNFILFKKGSATDRLYGNEELNSGFLYSYYTNLADVVDAHDFVDSVHIYLPHRNMIVSSDGISYLDGKSKYTRSTAEKKELFVRRLNGEQWISTYKNSNGKNIITFIIDYSPSLNAIPKAMIAIDINEESIQTAFSNMGSNDDVRIAIINENGAMISNSDKSLLYHDISEEKYIKRILQSDKEAGWFVSRTNGAKKLVSFFKSKYNNWSYISITDIGAIFVTNKVILSFTLVVYIIALITGLIGVYFVSKSHYMPIRDLATLVSALTEKGDTESAYDVLSNAIFQMDDNIKQYKKFTENMLPMVKNNLAYELLHNNIDREYLEKQYMILEIPSNNGAFTVIDFQFHMSESDSSAYFEYSLIEYFNALNNENRTVLCLSQTLSVTVIICAADEKQLGVDVLVNDISRLCEENDNLYFQMYVGETVDDIKQISDLYKRIQAIKKYSFVYGGFYVLYLRDIEERERSMLTIDSEALFKNLKAQLDSGEEKEVNSIFSNVIHRLKNESFSYDYIQELMMQLISFVTDYIKDIKPETEELAKKKERLYEIYKSADSLDQVIECVQSVCTSIVYDNKDEPKNYELSTQIKEFIDSIPNEEMKNVTLMYVADKLMLSQAYISRMFKNETGERFINYLTNIKLERSAELLRNKNIKIKNVCDIMGYSNANYFIKKFREKYGITPKQYQFKIK